MIYAVYYSILSMQPTLQFHVDNSEILHMSRDMGFPTM